MRFKIIMTVLVGMMFSLNGTLSAAKNQLVSDLTALVVSAEKNGAKYTEQQWKEANAQFDALVEKFKAQKDSMTEKERGEVHDLIGRYRAAVTNSGCESAIKEVTNTYNKVADATTDAWNETKSFFKGVFKKKDKK